MWLDNLEDFLWNKCCEKEMVLWLYCQLAAIALHRPTSTSSQYETWVTGALCSAEKTMFAVAAGKLPAVFLFLEGGGSFW